MADAKAFLELERATPKRQPVDERVRHWREFYQPMPESGLRQQARRCMDCGVPFCQGDSGCPVQNVIPEWNALVRRGRWREALASLHATNNFPEFTGRLCPAPCESACVLGIVAEPVAIRTLEQSIVDRGFHEGWIAPQPPDFATGKRVAIVGSGPAGLAAAQQLRRRGHDVIVFEKADRIGGLLRYGIPGFKMEKDVLDRRLAQLRAEGVRFRARAHVGVGPAVEQLRAKFDAILIAIGAEQPRDLSVPGRELDGIAMASEFLTQQNRRDAGDVLDPATSIDARDRNVIIIGGGDTGSDCAGTALRQGARTVRQFELLPQPPGVRPDYTPWPLWPMQLRTSHAHEEGCSRDWSVSTTAFTGRNGHVEELQAVRVESRRTDSGRVNFEPQPGSEFHLAADLVLIAMGFTGPCRESLLPHLGVELAPNGAIATDSAHQTNVPGIFAAGDARRGASLIVWAIREGRDAADAIDSYLSC